MEPARKGRDLAPTIRRLGREPVPRRASVPTANRYHPPPVRNGNPGQTARMLMQAIWCESCWPLRQRSGRLAARTRSRTNCSEKRSSCGPAHPATARRQGRRPCRQVARQAAGGFDQAIGKEQRRVSDLPGLRNDRWPNPDPGSRHPGDAGVGQHLHAGIDGPGVAGFHVKGNGRGLRACANLDAGLNIQRCRTRSAGHVRTPHAAIRHNNRQHLGSAA